MAGKLTRNKLVFQNITLVIRTFGEDKPVETADLSATICVCDSDTDIIDSLVAELSKVVSF